MPEAANSSIPKVLTLFEPTGMYDVSREVQLGIDSNVNTMDLIYSTISDMELSENINGAMGSRTKRFGFVFKVKSMILSIICLVLI